MPGTWRLSPLNLYNYPPILQRTVGVGYVAMDGSQEEVGWHASQEGVGRKNFDPCISEGIPILLRCPIQENRDWHQDQDLHSSTVKCHRCDFGELSDHGTEYESWPISPLLAIWRWTIFSPICATIRSDRWGGNTCPKMVVLLATQHIEYKSKSKSFS